MNVRVMIIDDEPNLCANLCAFFEDEGFEVFSAYSGEDALAFLDGGVQVDVVVTDMRLPGMDGNDTVRAIHAKYPAVRFAVHTGTAQYSVPDDLQAIGLEKKWVFRKPLQDMAVLADAIVQLAEQEGSTPRE